MYNIIYKTIKAFIGIFFIIILIYISFKADENIPSTSSSSSKQLSLSRSSPTSFAPRIKGKGGNSSRYKKYVEDRLWSKGGEIQQKIPFKKEEMSDQSSYTLPTFSREANSKAKTSFLEKKFSTHREMPDLEDNIKIKPMPYFHSSLKPHYERASLEQISKAVNKTQQPIDASPTSAPPVSSSTSSTSTPASSTSTPASSTSTPSSSTSTPSSSTSTPASSTSTPASSTSTPSSSTSTPASSTSTPSSSTSTPASSTSTPASSSSTSVSSSSTSTSPIGATQPGTSHALSSDVMLSPTETTHTSTTTVMSSGSESIPMPIQNQTTTETVVSTSLPPIPVIPPGVNSQPAPQAVNNSTILDEEKFPPVGQKEKKVAIEDLAGQLATVGASVKQLKDSFAKKKVQQPKKVDNADDLVISGPLSSNIDNNNESPKESIENFPEYLREMAEKIIALKNHKKIIKSSKNQKTYGQLVNHFKKIENKYKELNINYICQLPDNIQEFETTNKIKLNILLDRKKNKETNQKKKQEEEKTKNQKDKKHKKRAKKVTNKAPSEKTLENILKND